MNEQHIAPDPTASHPELEFFNNLSATLRIALDAPAKGAAGLYNVFASPDARIARLRLEAEICDPDGETFRPLTPAELEGVAFDGPAIRLRSRGDDEVVTHFAPNGSHFSVGELLRAVEATERRARPRSRWYGGVDVHHVFFERIYLGDGGVWTILWGS
jgi:hypothetical protein